LVEVSSAKGEPFTRIEAVVKGLFGLPCCRRRVGRRRSVSFGFGSERFHGDPKLPDGFYGEWEIGTYYAAWRVVQAGKVLCGSEDVVDSVEGLNDRLGLVELGRPVGIQMLSEFDVRLSLDENTDLDFLGTLSEADEHIVHIFGPDDLYVEYAVETGWEIGTSAEPLR
jgi:hypothetical protein